MCTILPNIMTVSRMLSYQRYLEAKKVVDDRSLSVPVFCTLKDLVGKDRELKVVELGAGIGTMVVRCVEWGLMRLGEYTAVDRDSESINYADQYLRSWARQRGLKPMDSEDSRLVLEGRGIRLKVNLECREATEFAEERAGEYDVLMAHLFLDLVDVEKDLKGFLGLLRPGGIFYFSHVFDGLTIVLPRIDADQNGDIERSYHETMDLRSSLTSGYKKGETGRTVLALLLDMDGVEVFEAGSSDWVVFPGPEGYNRSEADFLHFMVDTMKGALEGTTIDPEALETWSRTRHGQVDEGSMALIAHQLDMVGSVK